MNLKELERFPYFTGKMLKAYFNINHPEVTLSRWKKQQKIRTIEKGTYTLQINPLTYATTLITPSYCSLRSALQHYQLTTQMPKKIQVLIQRRKQDTHEITFIQTNHMFGYEKIKIEGFDLFMATKEKLLIDCLLFQNTGISTEEMHPLLNEKLDTDTIISFLKRIGNLSLIKRAGYLLEQHGTDIHDEFKELIEQDTNYAKLNQLLPRTRTRNKKWKINENS